MIVTIQSPLSITPIVLLAGTLVRKGFNFDIEQYDENCAEITVHMYAENGEDVDELHVICEGVYKQFPEEGVVIEMYDDEATDEEEEIIDEEE